MTLSVAPWAGPGVRPIKEITLAAALLAFGALGTIGGILMAANRVGSDRAQGYKASSEELMFSNHLTATCCRLIPTTTSDYSYLDFLGGWGRKASQWKADLKAIIADLAQEGK
uniref:Uncharacterized protein n=1 Tax=Oryza punctata TaxID=4537 RepID=A0A0E0L0E9_ORYPU